ncbi:MAG TPA: phosphoribosyltransferase family protein [Terriglobales bacterium]|nr:phosphoribosyltransferase family protein [Terriglobales bacterium]
MQANIGIPGTLKPVLTADQIQRRVIDMARQINTDYAGRTLNAVCVLEDGFVFMADLVRHLDIPVICQFLKPFIHEVQQGDMMTTEIKFAPEVDVQGGDVILFQGLLQSGITTEFLIRNLTTRGANSVKVATLLDRQTGRRVMLQPDYFGFLVDENYLFGYGLGNPKMGRNLPFVATTTEAASQKSVK